MREIAEPCEPSIRVPAAHGTGYFFLLILVLALVFLLAFALWRARDLRRSEGAQECRRKLDRSRVGVLCDRLTSTVFPRQRGAANPRCAGDPG
jgi:hypothetical protein